MNQSRQQSVTADTATAPHDPSAWSGPKWLTRAGAPGWGMLAAFLLAYMLAAGFGRWMMVIPDFPITVWPPNGVVLAMLLTRPRSTWPWFIGLAAAGEMAGNLLWFGNPLLWASGYIAANAAGVLLAAVLLTPHLGTPLRRIETLRQTLAFLLIGVLVAPMVSATLGSAIDALAGKNPFAVTWPIWWLGDATGILIATPLVISALNIWQEKRLPSAAQAAEGAVIAMLLFGLVGLETLTGAARGFLLPVPIVWAALRFEFRGAALAVLCLAVAIAFHTQRFSGVQLSTEILTQLHSRMQALLIVAASTGLIVAAIVHQQRRAVEDLARANSALEQRVAERTKAIEAAEQRFRTTFQNAGVGISIVSGDGRLMRVNESLARMLGRDVDEMEGQPIARFTHPADIPLGQVAWDRLEAGETDEYELEKRYVRKDGELVWGHTTVSCVRRPNGKLDYLIKIIQDVTDRKRSDEGRQMLMREVNHRSKNLLTIVQVIARQTAAHSPDDFTQTFTQRLQALAANQDLLVNSDWQRVGLVELINSQLAHFAAVGARVHLSGPRIMVPPAAAQALSMALHELATNAAKYGSLSNETGRVEVTWTVKDDRFHLCWREIGGPGVTPPETVGFGTTVLDRMTAASLSGEVTIDYRPDGLVWDLDCPLDAVRGAPDA